nr:MAG: Thymidylate synthase complementing protein [Bacteriophage sp.]
MKLIESSVQIIEEKDPYKMIELAGRTCYKSEDKITEDSAKEFVDRMIKLGHGAMLEHGTIYLTIAKTAMNIGNPIFYIKNKYSKVNEDSLFYYITTNMRVLVENNRLDDLQYQVEPTEHHEKRITAKFICDRATANQFVRHRVFSFAQESQRYCNYSKDKYNSEITIVKPHWWTKEDDINATLYLDVWRAAEHSYNTLIENGIKPQDARSVLPNATKTELVMTGFESDWDHFLSLRCSGAAHPDAKKLADELYKLIHK